MNFSFKEEYDRAHRYFLNIGKVSRNAQTGSLLWLSLSIATVTILILTAIKPTIVTIAQLNKEIKDKKEASQKLQTKINSLVAAQKTYADNFDNILLLEEALPEKNEFPKLSIFLEEMASASGVQLKSLSFEKIIVKQPPSPNNPLVANSFISSVTVTGEYLNLKEFLKGLETSRRVLVIEGSTLGLVKKSETWELSLQFTGRAAYGNGEVQK